MMAKENQIKTVVIIPAFNEAERIGNVVQAALRADLVDMVIVVDDGSSDETSKAAAKAGKLELARLKKLFFVKKHEVNAGKTGALITGVNYAKKVGRPSLQTFVFLDADCSPIWSRYTKQNMKLWRLVLSKLLKKKQNEAENKESENDFINLLANYIDKFTNPVVIKKDVMFVGIPQRNPIADTYLLLGEVMATLAIVLLQKSCGMICFLI